MKKLLLLLLAVAASLALAQAQDGQLKGIVKDSAGQPIPFANVSVYLGPQLFAGTVGDIDGEYTLKFITPGTYDVEFSAVGYQKLRVTGVEIRDSGKITFLNGTLHQSNDLKTVTIESYKVSAVAYDQAVQGQEFNRDYALKNPSRDVVGMVNVTGGANFRSGEFLLRGSRISPSSKQAPSPIARSDEYTRFKDNAFQATRREPLSTFSVDVDKASYTLVQKIIREGRVPESDAVRTEELINYFDYNYPDPTDEHPFRILTEITECPWNKDSHLLKIALQGKRLSAESLPPSSFTFLVDVSGSMSDPNKLPLVQASLLKLLDRMRPQDQVGIVVYAGAAGVVLETRPVGNKAEIVSRIMAMQAGGSTAGGAGIQKAYDLAEKHFIKGGNNRIILCTDGDFNVGVSSESDLTSLIEKERQKGVFLTVLGYGMGNYKDAKLELLADKGNGNYAYIDTYAEAEKFLGREFAGSMYTIAKDVKIQVEFNPAHVKSYRLIGYEDRLLAAKDFNDDKKDAGEIGSGHTVTALYEIRTDELPLAGIDSLKYQQAPVAVTGFSGELATVKFRYKKPDGDQSILMVQPVAHQTRPFRQAQESTRFAVAVAAFGQLLRHSEYTKGFGIAQIMDLASVAMEYDKEGYRKDFLELLKEYKKLDGIVKN